MVFSARTTRSERQGDPFARPHVHGTHLLFEAAQFCRNLVVAFGAAGKREVAQDIGVRHADHEPRIVRRTPASGAPVWSTMEPTTIAADCAAAGTARPKTISAAATVS